MLCASPIHWRHFELLSNALTAIFSQLFPCVFEEISDRRFSRGDWERPGVYLLSLHSFVKVCCFFVFLKITRLWISNKGQTSRIYSKPRAACVALVYFYHLKLTRISIQATFSSIWRKLEWKRCWKNQQRRQMHQYVDLKAISFLVFLSGRTLRIL